MRRILLTVIQISLAANLIGCTDDAAVNADIASALLRDWCNPSPEQLATDAGYTVPAVPVQDVTSFTTTFGTEALTDSAHCMTYSAITDAGVVTFTATVSTGGYAGTISHQIWINGQYLSAGTSGSLVLDSDANYFAFLILENGVVVARSEVMNLSSSIGNSLLRFVLSWDGDGDVDLHLDDGSGGRHVYYIDKIYDTGDFNVQLDVDNTVAYGPENIRVYSAPSGSNFRCWINYYAGSLTLNATVRVYVSGIYQQQYNFVLPAGTSNGSSSYEPSHDCGNHASP